MSGNTGTIIAGVGTDLDRGGGGRGNGVSEEIELFEHCFRLRGLGGREGKTDSRLDRRTDHHGRLFIILRYDRNVSRHVE